VLTALTLLAVPGANAAVPHPGNGSATVSTGSPPLDADATVSLDQRRPGGGRVPQHFVGSASSGR